ncbi:MarR family transcriptional regulator [Actinomyces ruminis]|uniref:MarR family transcriptional regulator n=1 Tax=Actinomyces ruminis TaxID=1937003 RepID=A0ABX4M9D0_9ACTO|nr:MarR family transcriptional regulator [Actinomyces ruminis]
MRVGTNLVDLGRYNANVVVHTLRRLGACSQRDIAAATGLSAQTVSAIVRGLQRQGLLAEVGTEVNGRGRPRTLLNIVSSARIAVGIHVDPSLTTVVTLDLGGNVTGSASARRVNPDDPHTAMAQVLRRCVDSSASNPSMNGGWRAHAWPFPARWIRSAAPRTLLHGSPVGVRCPWVRFWVVTWRCLFR